MIARPGPAGVSWCKLKQGGPFSAELGLRLQPVCQTRRTRYFSYRLGESLLKKILHTPPLGPACELNTEKPGPGTPSSTRLLSFHRLWGKGRFSEAARGTRCAASTFWGMCRCFGSLYWSFFFAFAHLAWAARRIFSVRCSGVIFFAVALPPLLPRATAIGFFRVIVPFIPLNSIQLCTAVCKPMKRDCIKFAVFY